ncbi:MAG: VOC family protein [Chloroflexi bacterium]|nr:VOC family protein [Chloroflexota bacterium]
MFKRIEHVEIVPSDPERSIRFYTDVFGFRVTERHRVQDPPPDEVIWLELNGTFLELVVVKDPAPPSGEPFQVGYRRMCLEVENLDKALEYLRSKGVRIAKGPVQSSTSLRADVRDPDDLSIELRQPLPRR